MGWAGDMILPIDTDRFWDARWILPTDCGCGTGKFCNDRLVRRQVQIYENGEQIACIDFPSRAVAESVIDLREVYDDLDGTGRE
jgi:hypothetical protein